MLYFNFSNYDEFEELFGVVEHGNGVKSRKNKILLALYKDKTAFKALVKMRSVLALREMRTAAQRRMLGTDYPDSVRGKHSHRWGCIYIRLDEEVDALPVLYRKKALAFATSLEELKKCLYAYLDNPHLRVYGCTHTLYLNGREYCSNLYATDDFQGLCEDGTVNAIRYMNLERGRVFKMKAGKMCNHILDCNRMTNTLPEQVRRWFSEEWVADWIDYARRNISCSEYELHVDDNFEAIYDSDSCAGYDEDNNSFRSCMVGDEQWTFYRDAVDAKAAYLTNNDGLIVARCIVFTDVHEEGSDKVLRLAERQYSKFGEYGLQRQLISALIQGGHIDGYKSVGASCSDAKKFVDNEGNSLSDKTFWIRCKLEDDDTISYQDSFKYFNYDEQKAYNGGYNHTYMLDTTSSTISIDNHEDDCWSELHGEYIDRDDAEWIETRDDYVYSNESVVAYVADDSGDYYAEQCYEDDCIEIDGEYYYAGRNRNRPGDFGIYECPHCGSWFVPDRENACHSELTEEDYCCQECLDEAETEFHEDHGDVYSDYDGEWYAEDEVVTALHWRWCFVRGRGFGYTYKKTTISIEEFNSLVESEEATEFCGKYYIDSVKYDGEPAHLGFEELVAA